MSFPDTISMEFPVLGTKTLVRLNDNNGGLYRLTEPTHRFQRTIRQSTMKNGRRRWNVEDIVVTFATATTKEDFTKSYMVHEFSENFLDTDPIKSLCIFTSEAGRIAKLLQGET
jgi:hypothetical protein